VSGDGKRFVLRNCSREKFVEVFQDAARKLHFTPERMKGITNYTARRTYSTLTLLAGVHPQMVALGAKHKKPANKVQTTFEYLNAALPNLLCASTAMALVAKRYRWLLCCARNVEATGHNTRLFDDQCGIMMFSRHMIQAVDDGRACSSVVCIFFCFSNSQFEVFYRETCSHDGRPETTRAWIARSYEPVYLNRRDLNTHWRGGLLFVFVLFFRASHFQLFLGQSGLTMNNPRIGSEGFI
jgi:hypothetical protein